MLTKMTTLKKRKKKNSNENRIGEDIDKKNSTTYTIEQAVQWPTSMASNIHTLKGLGVSTSD